MVYPVTGYTILRMARTSFTPTYELFREHLILAREQKRLTQVELAAKLNKPQSFVSKYERGERRLDVLEFIDITRALGVDAKHFITKLKGQYEKKDLSEALYEELNELTDGQLRWIEAIIKCFKQPANFRRNNDSDIISDCVLSDFGDHLLIHHSFSAEPFTKDKFEYALERTINHCYGDNPASLAPKGNPGHDITIKGERFSLKTQADKNIALQYLHISKFHELGKGKWTNNLEDLYGLRTQFFEHMQSYERILILRRINPRKKDTWHYELVEIPKSLLKKAINGRFEMKHESTQNPKPGYCYVTDRYGDTMFNLYFDGGTERKLQIKKLDKSLCIVHAEWIFPKP